MNPNQTKNDAITRQEDDFAQWYTDVCKKAELMDYSSVKGFIVYLPYGYAIWEEIQNYCNKKFKEKGAQNVYLPLVIPQSLFATEKEHVEGFAPECLVATIGGGLNAIGAWPRSRYEAGQSHVDKVGGILKR